MIKRTFLNEKQDIWSLGCIIQELITLDPLFEGDNSLLISSKVVDGDTSELIKDKFNIDKDGNSNNTQTDNDKLFIEIMQGCLLKD